MKRKLALTVGVAVLGGAVLTGFAPAAGAAPVDAQAIRGKVTLYQAANYKEGHKSYKKDDKHLGNDKFHNGVTVGDKVSSVKNKSNRSVRLYKHANFMGPSTKIKPGKKIAHLRGYAVGNDAASSIDFL